MNGPRLRTPNGSRKPWLAPRSDPNDVFAPRGPRPWQVVVLLALAGYLLFAHGCHGDEDHELFHATPIVSHR